MIFLTSTPPSRNGGKFVIRADLVDAFDVADRATAMREVEQHLGHHGLQHPLAPHVRHQQHLKPVGVPPG